MKKKKIKEIEGEDFQSIINQIRHDMAELSTNLSNNTPIKELQCRVCGFGYDEENAPWQRLDGERFPSYEICVCCNVQFGYEDVYQRSVSLFREKWISSGGDFHQKALMPKNWSLERQLKNINKEWQD